MHDDPLKREVGAVARVWVKSLRHHKRYLNAQRRFFRNGGHAKTMRLRAFARYWSGEQTFDSANRLPLYYSFEKGTSERRSVTALAAKIDI